MLCKAVCVVRTLSHGLEEAGLAAQLKMSVWCRQEGTWQPHTTWGLTHTKTHTLCTGLFNAATHPQPCADPQPLSSHLPVYSPEQNPKTFNNVAQGLEECFSYSCTERDSIIWCYKMCLCSSCFFLSVLCETFMSETCGFLCLQCATKWPNTVQSAPSSAWIWHISLVC